MGAILATVLKAIFGSIADVFTSWFRDRQLKKLGYAEAQRDVVTEQSKRVDSATDARRGARARDDASGVRDAVRPDDRPWDPNASG